MSQGTSTIHCDATLQAIDKWTILRLPAKASEQLPSRGQVAAQGTINSHVFQTVLEPDGSGGHWVRVEGKLQRAAGVSAGDTVTLDIEPSQDWPEPTVPQDLKTALTDALRRSKFSGKALRPWRVGNGFAGSTRPETVTRANEGSRSAFRR
ncbi:MAG: DUF1905 domain-containing protein [Candidatus Dormibacteraeota bacterium]|nr:DUF1905 domain-containing protein [Candidatus Dormibacteraeota bacterium]